MVPECVEVMADLLPDTHHVSSMHENGEQLSKGEFCAAMYDGSWYIGVVVDIDPDDDEYEISFMEKKKQFYQWPKPTDMIWVKQADILCKIVEPVPASKHGRMMKLDASDLALILDMYNEVK